MNVIADYHDLCGECPIWDADTSILYWTDCAGRRFYRYDPTTGVHQIVNEGLEINGYRINRSGGFIIANTAGIWHWDGAHRTTLIASEVDGSKCQMNDCVSDPAGRLFAGSLFYDPAKEYPLGKLMRVECSGKVAIVDEGFHLSNGLAFSPDYSKLYYADFAGRRIYAYDYRPVTGELRNRRVLVEVPRDEGLPDGLAVDAEGFLWSAQWYGACVVRYDPDGKVERRIPTPAKQTSSLAFGGSGLMDIFITSAARSEPMPVMPPGYDAVNGFFGGPLYQINVGITGRAECKTDITINN